jgi:hypothetical protein
VRAVGRAARPPFALALAAALALAFAGCGGGDGGRLSKEDLIKQGDQECQAQRARDEQIGAFQSVRALAAKGDQQLQADRDALARFARLRPPADLQDEFDAYVKLLREATEVEAQFIDAAKNRDVPRLRRLNLRQQALRPKLSDAARKVGFKFCSQGGG